MMYRYVRDKKGRCYHLARVYRDGSLDSVAVCGRRPRERWQRSSNVPWGNACRNCLKKVADLPTIPVI